MIGKEGKKAVIINNIASDSIEQAIFILKPDSFEQSDIGKNIVAEAQEIINSYISKVEKNGDFQAEKNKKRLIAAICGAGALITAIVFLLMFLM